MPVHDWTKVDAGIFHAFHQQWLIAISNRLNKGLLPGDFYALPEQHGAGYGPDVLTLEFTGGRDRSNGVVEPFDHGGGGTSTVTAPPKMAPTAETAIDFYRRKQSALVIRHISGDRMVAVIEVVSPGNKSSVSAMRKLVEKASSLLLNGIHLLILDLFPPTPRDPNGVHALVWDDICGEHYEAPPDKRLAAISYESDSGIRAFVKHMAIGDVVPEMPLFLARNQCVTPPLEESYQASFAEMPVRWQRVLQSD